MPMLTTEQYKNIDTRIVTIARNEIVARKLFSAKYGPLGFGVEVVDTYTLSEMSKGRIDLEWGQGLSQDVIGILPESTRIPVLHKEWRIPYRKLVASKRMGIPLDTSVPDAAAYAYAEIEEDFLIQGYTKDGTIYDLKGFFQAAGNAATGATWATEASILPDIEEMIGLLVADNIRGPYNLVLNQAQESELWIRETGGAGRWLADVIRERIKGNILVSGSLADSQGFMLPVNNAVTMDLVVGQDLSTKSAELPINLGQDLYGITFSCIVPRFKDTNAVCKITGH